MSLSYFFRDYVYIPLGGNRCSLLLQLRNLAVVWLLTGLWHGANWNFILWGFYYLAFLLLEKFVMKPLGRQIPSPIRWAYAMFVVSVGWLIFRMTDMGCLNNAFWGLFGAGGRALTNLETNVQLKSNFVFLLVAMLACTPLARNLYRKIDKAIDSMPVLQKAWTALQCAGPVLLLILSTAALVGDQYNPFLYYRF